MVDEQIESLKEEDKKESEGYTSSNIIPSIVLSLLILAGIIGGFSFSMLAGLITVGVLVAITVGLLIAWYEIVPPSEAHLVGSATKRMVCAQDEKLQKNGGRAYFAIWEWIPFFARTVRIMDITVKELTEEQETIEKDQARYNVDLSLKYRISDVETAAERYISEAELKKQLSPALKSAIRAVTVKYDVTEARAKKDEMEKAVKEKLQTDLKGWGISLVNFQMVDFRDTKDSTIISDISKRREAEIQATTKKQVADKDKDARLKVAKAEEEAKRAEIEKDQRIGEKEQNKHQKIYEQEKIAQEMKLEVTRVQQVKQAEINKEQAVIDQTKEKEVEAIKKEQKKLEGEGDRDRDVEQAKGKAAETREELLAEAEGKDKLQEALNKFKPEAITALTAEMEIKKNEAVGVATAGALEKADLKVFAGDGEAGKDGFNLGKMISATSVAEPSTADALNNKLARPNDLGLTALGLQKLADEAKEREAKKAEEDAKAQEEAKKQEKNTNNTNNIKTKTNTNNAGNTVKTSKKSTN